MIKKPCIILYPKETQINSNNNISQDSSNKIRSLSSLNNTNTSNIKTTLLDKLPNDDSVPKSPYNESEPITSKNCWSGYHVLFRDPRNFHQFAIDEKFNRWGDMVEFFKNQNRPYKLSQGSLKDLLYGTYKRKGMHSVSLNDLVMIQKIGRDKITKVKSREVMCSDCLETELLEQPESLLAVQECNI